MGIVLLSYIIASIVTEVEKYMQVSVRVSGVEMISQDS